MKNPFLNTLIPLTAVLLISGLVLLTALHLRQTDHLKTAATQAAMGQQIVQQADTLQDAWTTQSAFAYRYISTSASTDLDSLHYYQQSVASALLQLQKNAASMPALKQQLLQAEKEMINSESLTASLMELKLAGIPITKKSADEAVPHQKFIAASDELDAIKLTVYATMQQQEMQYLVAQKTMEHVRLGTLVTLAISFLAFLYLLYQDVHSIINRKRTQAVEENLVLDQSTAAQPLVTNSQLSIRSRNLQAFLSGNDRYNKEKAEAQVASIIH